MRKYLIAIPMLVWSMQSCHKDDDVKIDQPARDTIIQNTTVFDPTFVIQGQQPVTADIRPIDLKKGDLIAVCAASNAITESEISRGVEIIKSWGLNVIMASNLYEQDGRYAGTLQQRINGMQEVINNPEVRAIIMARGGYGAGQILPYIDWKGMYDSPKWLIGYSDITALHTTINNMGIETIHGPMVKDLSNDEGSTDRLRNALFGNPENIEIATNSYCIKGQATGRLVGGCLSMLYSMSGTPYDLNTQDAILFIEDTGESNYSVDRMMLNLQQSGKLQHIKGLIVGDFIGCTQGIDLPINEIIHKYADPLKIPVVYGIKSGHNTVNTPLIMGRKVTITVDSKTAKVEFEKSPPAAK